VWGDHAKEAFAAFFKLPAGSVASLHTHTHAMKVVFLSGTYIQAPERKSGGPARSGFLHDAARRELPARYILRRGLGVPLFAESNERFDLRPLADGKVPVKK
jgi:hypothetical protein